MKNKMIGSSVACIAVIAMVLGSGCTQGPNKKDGIYELAAATGTIAVSPGDYETLKEKVPVSGNSVSRSYSKSGGKETVELTGPEGNSAVFWTGQAPGIADIRIKGSKTFVEKTISEVERIIGAKAAVTHHELISETATYAGFQKGHVALLEEELGKTMTAQGRSSSSRNDVESITFAFGKGLNGVRMKFSGKDSSLRGTIEGDQEFVDGIKSLLNKVKESN